MHSPEELPALVAFSADVAGALLEVRRLSWEGGKSPAGLSPADGTKQRELVVSAQALEAHFVASLKDTPRFDLFERAKMLRDRADTMAGIVPPPPDKESPEEKNAAAERRVAAATGANGSGQ